MYSIPAPVIKKLLDYCDLPSAIVMARVTKRCSSIFNQYREEILIRCEYVNVPNMFRRCSDEFIIHMSKHEFFDKKEARKCCRQMRYYLHEKLEYGKLYYYDIDKELLREIYKNGEHNNIRAYDYKLQAAKLGINLNVPYSNDKYGLQAALLLRDEKMIIKLQEYGSFYTYCVTGNYHLADNYEISYSIICINDSIDPVATFNYIEKRGYELNSFCYVSIEHYEVLKLVIDKITSDSIIDTTYLDVEDYNVLMLLFNKFLEIRTVEDIFYIFVNKNVNFAKYLLQTYIIVDLDLNRLYYDIKINLLDILDNELVMKYACNCNEYTLIRALIRRNGQQWARKFKHPFIEKYY